MEERERTAATALVAECEAFLNGTLAEYWEDMGIVVPVWAWINLLAHGRPEQVTDSVSRPAASAVRPSWAIARAYMAYEVLDLLDAEFTLADMQATVLVPLELEWRPDPSRPVVTAAVAGHGRLRHPQHAPDAGLLAAPRRHRCLSVQ